MQIISDRKEKIFKFIDYKDRPVYKIGLSKKDINGKYVNGYMLCSFKKGTNIQDKSFIKIKSAWLDFYLKDKETIPYIFINEFEIVDDEVMLVEDITTEDLDNMPLPS
jgi:hypothetical protein